MKRTVNVMIGALLLIVTVLSWAPAQELNSIKLNEPNKKRGIPVMEALSLRASVREWSEKDLSLQDLSDLLWAADGINRADKRRTAPSATNAQDVDIYVFMKNGVYLYDAANSELKPVLAGDHRSGIMMSMGAMRGGAPGGPPGAAGSPAGSAPPGGAPGGAPGGTGGAAESNPPVQLVLVTDISRFRAGTQELKLEWGGIDAGIVSQNISLFCAATDIGTRPRAAINKEGLKTLLKLTDTQYPLLNHPIGYRK